MKLAEKQMTVEDWNDLLALCDDAADRYSNRPLPARGLVAKYEALGEKCRLRALAAREGRVVP